MNTRTSPLDALTTHLGDAPNTLLLAPALESHADEVCFELLTATNPAQENVLSITFTQSAEDRLALWDTHVDKRPAQAGIISIDGLTRSIAASSTVSPQPSTPISVTAVSNPGDLTELGITISTYLDDWEATDNQTVICFHSLTPLLQYVDLQRAFRFLHVLTGRIESAEATAHYHIDPSAHDQQTISTLTQLFDAIIECDGGTYRCQTPSNGIEEISR